MPNKSLTSNTSTTKSTRKVNCKTDRDQSVICTRWNLNYDVKRKWLAFGPTCLKYHHSNDSAACCHSRTPSTGRSDTKTLTMKVPNSYTTALYDIGNRTITLSEDTQHLPAKHTLHPMTLQTHLRQWTAQRSHKSWDKWHLGQKHICFKTTTTIQYSKSTIHRRQHTTIFWTF